MSPATRRQQRVTFAVLTVAVASFALLQSLIVPVLAHIQVEFDTDQSTVTWVLTAYLLSASICTPLLGRIGDVVGKKRMLVARARRLSRRVADRRARAEHRLADRRAGRPGRRRRRAAAVLRDHPRRVHARQMTNALTVLASLTAVGFGVGIVVAGPIVDALGYHWLFWLPMVVTAVAAVAALALRARVARCAPRSGCRCSRPCCSPAGWSRCCSPLSQGNQWGWTSRAVLGLFARRRSLAAAWVAARDPRAGPADRHADDAAPRRVDDQPGRRLRRLRDVRVVRLPPTAAADPASRPATASARRSPSRAGCCCPRRSASFLVGFVTAPPDRAAAAPARSSSPARSSPRWRSPAIGAVPRPHLAAATPPRPSRASAPAWSSRAWPAWWSPRCPPSRPASRAG